MTQSIPSKPEGLLPTSARVLTLGRFRVERDGEPLRFRFRAHRKPLQLLKVLVALGGERVPETQLSDALWPDANGDQAHAAFATTLHRLRKLVGADALALRDGTLSLDSHHCWLDTWAFERAMEQATAALAAGDPAAPRLLEEALALYRGPFLDGEFEPPEILPARERLQGFFLRHVDDAGRGLLEAGEATRAMALYRRALEIDPVSEDLTRGLMRSLLATGELAEGLVAYRRLRNLLRSTFDVAPSQETEALHEALLAAGPGSPPGPDAQPDQGTAIPRPGGLGWLRRRPRRITVVATVLVLAVLAGALAVGLAWRVERARTEATVAEFRRSTALLLPDKPSIAVLAFDNLSGDPAQDYFSEGLSDDLITKLATLPQLFVIARNSSFQYQGKAVDVRQIGRELGVRYVLEGSVQKAAGRVRVNVQLNDAATGRHVWAQRYERELKDVFAVQDEIVHRLLTEIAVKLVSGEGSRYGFTPPANQEAFDLYLRARKLWWSHDAAPMTPEHFQARELIAEAVALAPDWAQGHAWMAGMYIWPAFINGSRNPREDLRIGMAAAQRALGLDPDYAVAHSMLGMALYVQHKYPEAMRELHRAVELAPNSANSHLVLGAVQSYAADPNEAIRSLKQGMRLNPHFYQGFLFYLAVAYRRADRYEEALQITLELVEKRPQEFSGYGLTALNLAALGRMDEARAMYRKSVQRFGPWGTLSQYRKRSRNKDPKRIETVISQMRKLGVPEN